MNKYKFSYYNYCFDYNDGSILFNSLTGQISKLLCSERKILSRNDTMYIANSLEAEKEKELINKGMLLNIEEDTEQCNLRCVYCYEKFTKGSMSIAIENEVLHFLDDTYNV